MSYGQKNYNELQGRHNPANGKDPLYRIAQIGCFVISDCNLLGRFGIDIGPLDLNAMLRDREIYVDVDDGVLDDLGWGSITAAYPEVTISRIVDRGRAHTAGWPSQPNAIVKFLYTSPNTGRETTHFCLVADPNAKTIVDSWDGVVRSAAGYGEPVAFAEYIHNVPQPIAPVSPAPQSDIVEVTVQPGWGITYVLRAAGYSADQYGNQAEWDRVAALNGSSGRLRLQPGQIVKVYRTPLPVAPPAPIPTPEVTVPAVEAVTTAAPAPDPDAWKKTFDKGAAGSYVCSRSTDVIDLEGSEPMLHIGEGQRATVAGSFEKDGQKYYRGAKHTSLGIWYGIPADNLRPLVQPKAKSVPVPKKDDDDSVFDSLLDDLDVRDELKQLRDNLTGRERLVAIVAKVYALFTKINPFKKKKG